jgi:hypothetical protein
MDQELLDQIKALKTAIRSGHQSVQYSGRTITYRSLEDMRSALKEMEREAGTATSGRKRTTPSYFKGY